MIYVVSIDNAITKYIFDSSGVNLKVITDVIIDKNNFTRVIGNMSVVINNGLISGAMIKAPLNAIKLPLSSTRNSIKETSNPWFGTLDLEIYTAPDGFNRVYAAGFKTSQELSLYYINKITMDSTEVILECINNMLNLCIINM